MTWTMHPGHSPSKAALINSAPHCGHFCAALMLARRADKLPVLWHFTHYKGGFAAGLRGKSK
jgi:hypothetical protein